MRRLIPRLLLVIASLGVALGATELALRALGVAEPRDLPPLELPGAASAEEAFTRWDRDLIYTMVPHTRALPEYEIDAWGYRSPEFAREKPAGTVRLVVTGDSSTFGLGVREEECWAGVLRAALQRIFEGAVEVELVNAGVCGYSSLLNRVQLERDLLPLRPDGVVVCLTGHNDTRLVSGATDAEVLARHHSLAGRLRRLRVVRLLLGLGRSPDEASVRPLARSEADGGRWRVPLDEVRAQAEAMVSAARAGGAGLVLAVTAHSRPALQSAPYVAQVGEAVAEVARAQGAALADARPAFAALAPHDLFVDSVHPTPLGHRLIARQVLAAVLEAVDWPGPARARAAFARAALAAAGGELPERAPELRAGDAPPSFREMLALCEDARALEARLAAGDAGLPDHVRRHDPVLGTAAGARSTARGLLALRAARADGRADDARAAQARLDELYAWVRPEDAWVGALGGAGAFLDAAPAQRSLGRALVLWLAAIGLPPERVDLRVTEARRVNGAGERDRAIALLRDVLALDPHDVQARFDMAWLLRQSGRPDEAREAWAIVAATDGADAAGRFAQGLLHYDAGELSQAERCLREAVAARPSLGLARYLLGRVMLETGQLDEAVRELAVATVIMGPLPEFDELRRRLAERASADDGADDGAGG